MCGCWWARVFGGGTSAWKWCGLLCAVRRIAGGLVSTHLVKNLAVGDTVQALIPAGRFGIAPDSHTSRRYVGIAAGSGITPILSILRSVLSIERLSEFTLLYGNRDTSSVMFIEQLADLKNIYASRLQIFHLLSQESRGIEVLDGRITLERFGRISVVPKTSITGFSAVPSNLSKRLPRT